MSNVGTLPAGYSGLPQAVPQHDTPAQTTRGNGGTPIATHHAPSHRAPSRPGLDIIAHAGLLSAAAASLAAQALDQIRSAPPGPLAGQLAEALCRLAAAQEKITLTVAAAASLWEDGAASAREQDAGRPRLRLVTDWEQPGNGVIPGQEWRVSGS